MGLFNQNVSFWLQVAVASVYTTFVVGIMVYRDITRDITQLRSQLRARLHTLQTQLKTQLQSVQTEVRVSAAKTETSLNRLDVS